MTAENDLEIEVSCSLKELYLGCVKSVEFVKRVVLPDNWTLDENKVMEKVVQIWPGMSEKTNIRFEGEGHQLVGYKNGALIIKINQLPHDLYKWSGNDLIYTHKLSLNDAIQIRPIEIITLDGWKLLVSND